MSSASKATTWMLAAILCLPLSAVADTDAVHHAHKIKKQTLAPLPSGTQGPVPQVPLDAIPAVAPQVSYQDGLLTIVAPNSTLGDILRGVRKHTSAEIDIPVTANERVVTRLGPAPARDVMAELLNGTRFNYILLGSPQDASALVRVVLVAKAAPEAPPAQPGAAPVATANAAEATEPDAADDTSDDSADQTPTEAAEQPTPPGDQPGIKTPQQMLQEMQQRQLLMQQQQQAGQPAQPVQPGAYPPVPGAMIPPRTPQQEQSQQPQ
jgi:hypothetical protein